MDVKFMCPSEGVVTVSLEYLITAFASAVRLLTSDDCHRGDDVVVTALRRMASFLRSSAGNPLAAPIVMRQAVRKWDGDNGQRRDGDIMKATADTISAAVKGDFASNNARILAMTDMASFADVLEHEMHSQLVAA